MAFKMTPGIKGNPSMNRIKNLGACGGPGQPPCEPRFQREVEEKRMQAVDRSSSARSKSVKAKKKAVLAPIKPAPPVKLQINLPKGYEFGSKKLEMMFYSMFEDAIASGEYKTQEQLDMAIAEKLKGGGPKDPKDPGGPVIVNPGKPVVVAPGIGGEGEFKASPIGNVIKK